MEPSADAATGALLARIATLEAELAAVRVQRTAERVSRIRLQRVLRSGSQSVVGGEAPALHAKAIGTLHSCFSRRNGTPRQPGLVPAARAALRLRHGVSPDSLFGLDGFSHCWVLYAFHANTDLHVAPGARPVAKSRVAVPRLDGETRGVLATRTPHRPVPLGLSLGRLLSVDCEKGVVVFEGLDLVDDTPVLDLKPYVRPSPECSRTIETLTISPQVPFCDAPAQSEPCFAPDWRAPLSPAPVLQRHSHGPGSRRSPEATPPPSRSA